jgi:hypothetical protein
LPPLVLFSGADAQGGARTGNLPRAEGWAAEGCGCGEGGGIRFVRRRRRVRRCGAGVCCGRRGCARALSEHCALCRLLLSPLPEARGGVIRPKNHCKVSLFCSEGTNQPLTCDIFPIDFSDVSDRFSVRPNRKLPVLFMLRNAAHVYVSHTSDGADAVAAAVAMLALDATNINAVHGYRWCKDSARKNKCA